MFVSKAGVIGAGTMGVEVVATATGQDTIRPGKAVGLHFVFAASVKSLGERAPHWDGA